MKPACAFLFDVDSTLVQTGGAGRRALGWALDTVGALSSAMDGVRLHGRTDRSIVREVLRRELDPESWTQLIARYTERLQREVETTSEYEVLPGVHTLLAALRARGAVLGLATGNVAAGAHIKLRRGGLLTYFAFGGYGDRHERRAELVREARTHAEAQAGRALTRMEVVVVGDSELDVEAAHAADCAIAAVATGLTSASELQAAGAEWVYPDLSAAHAAPPFA